MVTCGCQSKHIENRRRVPSPHHPPTHPTNVQQWKAFTYEEDFLQETNEILREKFCEKAIFQEEHFARKGFWEKDILWERDFERRTNLILLTDLKEWINYPNPLNQNWSIRVKQYPHSLAKEDHIWFCGARRIHIVRSRVADSCQNTGLRTIKIHLYTYENRV